MMKPVEFPMIQTKAELVQLSSRQQLIIQGSTSGAPVCCVNFRHQF